MGFGDVWRLVRNVEQLFQLESLHGQAISELKANVLDLERRLTRLEVREDVVVNEAKAAARAASSEATQGAVADLARRIGALEANADRFRQIGRD